MRESNFFKVRLDTSWMPAFAGRRGLAVVVPVAKAEHSDQKPDHRDGRDSYEGVVIMNDGFRHDGLPLRLPKGKRGGVGLVPGNLMNRLCAPIQTKAPSHSQNKQRECYS